MSESDRHELYSSLEDAIGKGPTETMMALLPPVGWADVATKHDLAGLERRIVTRFDSRFERMEARFDRIEGRFEGIDAKFEALESRITARIYRKTLLVIIPTILASFALALAALRIA